MCPHETLTAHLRRFLDQEYTSQRLDEPVSRFAARMAQAVAHLNSPDFADANGRGLRGLASSMRDRCAEVVECGGGRIPK